MAAPRFQAVVFDLYGTLLSIGDMRRPYRQLLALGQARGRPLSPGDAHTLMSQPLGLLEAAKQLGIRLSPSEQVRLDEDLRAELASIRLFDDSVETLEQLRRAGIKLALCSNLAAPYAEPAMALLPPLDVYGWSFELGCIKPDAQIYREVCSALKLDRTQVAMIGDTLEADVQGAIRAGLTGYHLQRSGTAITPGFANLRSFTTYILTGC